MREKMLLSAAPVNRPGEAREALTFRWRDSTHRNQRKLLNLSLYEFLGASCCTIKVGLLADLKLLVPVTLLFTCSALD